MLRLLLAPLTLGLAAVGAVLEFLDPPVTVTVLDAVGPWVDADEVTR